MEVLAFHRLAKVIRPVALIAAGFAFFSVPAISQAAEPGKDHPLVGRYEGSVLAEYRSPKYDQAAFIKGPLDNDEKKNELLQLEGNVSFYRYNLPANRSTLEVMRNYESGLKARGLEIIFSCDVLNGSCHTDGAEYTGNGRFVPALRNRTTRWPNEGDLGTSCGGEGDSRYLLAKHEASSGTTYVSLAVCDWVIPAVWVAVVESKEMDTNKLKFIDATEMKKSVPAEPGKDHPLVGRYEGSVLAEYRSPKYDQAALIKGLLDNDEKKNELLQLEGNVSFYRYNLPPNRSTLEVMRNYESGLKAKGLEIIFSCGVLNGSCHTDGAEYTGNGRFVPALRNRTTRWPNEGDLGTSCGGDGDSRYLLAKHEASSGTTYVSLAVCDWVIPAVWVAVVESKEMDTNKLKFINATEMKKSLDTTGRVNLYGIYFDTDKDIIKPDSKPTLDEIGKLMKGNPQLHLQVVGHTDSTGGDAHNRDLSSRRAVSVMQALTGTGIDAGRFTSRGAGASEPVASNDSEQGRAKNRRVELVGM